MEFKNIIMMRLKRIIKLFFFNKLHQLQCQMAFRFRAIKNGSIIDKGLYGYNLDFVSIGKNLKIKRNWRIECYPYFCHQKLEPHLEIGENVIINYGFTAFVANKIDIGPNCIFAANVTLVSENHGINPESDLPYHAQSLTTGPIFIGEGCWIGQNVVVLPNVNIGAKCVVGANSVVTKDIPPYSIAVGIPAKVIKQYSFESNRWETFNKV